MDPAMQECHCQHAAQVTQGGADGKVGYRFPHEETQTRVPGARNSKSLAIDDGFR